MPGMYAGKDYDLAGFAVGAAERGEILTGADVAAGDVVLGLASSGVHSNGYSLVRRIVEKARLSYGDEAPFAAGASLGEALLTPTRIYVKPVLAAVRAGTVKALAHITGGGLTDNIPRVLPEGLGVALDATAWPLLPVFRWMADSAAIDDNDLARTFNCGIGMVVITAPDKADEAQRILSEAGEAVYRIGEVQPAIGDVERVVIDGVDTAWHG